MSEAKYTKGPWEFDTSDKTIVGAEKCLSIAEISNMDAGGAKDYYFGAESNANANLIAAAPELLEALQGVLRVADRATIEFDAARAAIAKALGSDNAN